MNILPLLFIGLLLGGDKLSSLKDIISRLDIPSFTPVFQLLGINQKTIDFLSSEEFSSSLTNGDIKSLLPILSALFTKPNSSDEKSEKESEMQKPCDYLAPIKNVAPTDVGATIENHFN